MTAIYSPTTQCYGKVRFRNKKEAKAAIKKVEARWGDRMISYHCPYDRENDNHYHMGHRVQDTMRRVREQQELEAMWAEQPVHDLVSC